MSPPTAPTPQEFLQAVARVQASVADLFSVLAAASISANPQQAPSIPPAPVQVVAPGTFPGHPPVVPIAADHQPVELHPVDPSPIITRTSEPAAAPTDATSFEQAQAQAAAILEQQAQSEPAAPAAEQPMAPLPDFGAVDPDLPLSPEDRQSCFDQIAALPAAKKAEFVAAFAAQFGSTPGRGGKPTVKDRITQWRHLLWFDSWRHGEGL
jgi:hypothetical protein